jgi:hypothetical protein
MAQRLTIEVTIPSDDYVTERRFTNDAVFALHGVAYRLAAEYPEFAALKNVDIRVTNLEENVEGYGCRQARADL